ncbi:MAG: hypothetical protein ACPG8W_03030 [Candidatus Promineifilaceae bacterium]
MAHSLSLPYYYSVHRLQIASELHLPELYPLVAEELQSVSFETVDATIRFGDVPTKLEEPHSEGAFHQAKPNQFLLPVDGIASYWVEAGKRITIQPEPQATEDEIRLFLLGSVLGALLHQRGQLILHGSAVQTPKGAVIFCGASGAGKSTLAAALQKRGYPVLADDVCAIKLDENGQPHVVPGVNRIKLWADATKKLNQPVEGLKRVRPQVEKYSVPLSCNCPPDAAPLMMIYELNKGSTDEILCETVTRQQKFSLLGRHTYRQEYMRGLGVQATHFQQVMRVGSRVAVQSITRPQTPYRLDELVEMLERDFNK